MNREQLKKLERDLWSAADKLRANSDLKASEYSTPVLGLIFLKFADNKYRQFEDAILAEYSKRKGTRRERTLQEIAIEAKPEQFDLIRDKLKSSKSMAEFAEFLKAGDFRFSGNQAVRAAEQLPLAGLDGISRMKDGDSALSQTPTGLNVLFLVGSRSQPVDEVRARPAIEAFLGNQRKGELVQKDLKAIREAAKIEYVGKFAESAPAAGASAPAAAPAQAPASAASGLDAGTISKGMGLK